MNNDNITTENLDGVIYHFSCAQKLETVKYKWDIHGHKDELRKDWFGIYENWKEGVNDLHPTSFGLWNATFFDKTTLPEILKTHPNYNKDVID